MSRRTKGCATLLSMQISRRLMKAILKAFFIHFATSGSLVWPVTFILLSVWLCGPVLPTSLIDLLERTAEEGGEVEKKQEIDYDDECLSDDD